MRKVKAEGGWAVVCTEQVEIHPTSDITPFIELRIWDDQDIPALARIADAIHEGGALAGIELVPQRPERAEPVQPGDPARPGPPAGGRATAYDPVQARAMTRSDIADLRRWHPTRSAARSRPATTWCTSTPGTAFGGDAALPVPPVQPPHRRVRRQRCGTGCGCCARSSRTPSRRPAGRAAVACRISVDEGRGTTGSARAEIEEILGELGELPDLWDFVPGSWEADSGTSRFGPEGEQEEFVPG